MNDVFLSYDSENRDRAQVFANTLEALGWSVWWDREIPLGKDFDDVIEHELNSARCVVVLWSKESVRSRWVKTEASAAAQRDRLVPVLIDQVTIPLEFRLIQSAELWDWNGDTANPEFERLIHAIKDKSQQPPADPAPIPKSVHTGSKQIAQRRWFPKLAAVAVIAVIVLGTLMFRNRGQEPASTSIPATPAGAPASTASRPRPQGYSIKIGDKVADGAPGQGAGIIETPYGADTFVFDAQPRQTVYFHMFPTSGGMPYIKWRLVDEDGTEVFNTCLGCTEPGVQTLTRGGVYTLTVGSEQDASTGAYQFQLWNVPPPQRFAIKTGDVIRENAPGPGAGAIESPGVEDVYTLIATPKQRVYFRILESSPGLSYIKWRLVDENGMEIFNTCFGCTEPGVQMLITGGAYTLTVGNRGDPSTGVYRLQLFNVPPPNQFSIRIGDRIQPGKPQQGAGVIESPGAEDVYVFNASPGQKVFFHLVEHSRESDYLKWRLTDENGMTMFDTCFGCTDPGLQPLTKGGNYTLTVGNTRNPSTGEYSFEIGSR